MEADAPKQADELLTTVDVAKLAVVGRGTVLRWVKAGYLAPAITTPGGRMRFRRSDVEAILTPSSSQEEAAC